MKSPLQKTRAALKRSRQNLGQAAPHQRDATSGLPVFEADTYARSPSESSLTKAKRSDYNLKELSESSESSDGRRPAPSAKADAKGRRSGRSCSSRRRASAAPATRRRARRNRRRSSTRTARCARRRTSSGKPRRPTASGAPSSRARPTRSIRFSRRWCGLRVLCLDFAAMASSPRPIDNGSVHTAPGPRPARARQRRQAAERRRREDAGLDRNAGPGRAARVGRRDVLSFVAVLWNGRILRLCERLIRDVVKSDAPMPASAPRLKTTLEPHHNWIMRSGARAAAPDAGPADALRDAARLRRRRPGAHRGPRGLRGRGARGRPPGRGFIEEANSRGLGLTCPRRAQGVPGQANQRAAFQRCSREPRSALGPTASGRRRSSRPRRPSRRGAQPAVASVRDASRS